MAGSQGAIRAGRAFVELFADSTQLVRGLNKAKAQLRSFGRDITQLGKQFAKATAVFATPFVIGAKTFAEFQQQGAFVSTMLIDANQHMGTFNKALRDMSVQFGESTETLSRGLFDILSATVPADKAIETLAVSVRAARAGMVSTRVAGDAITTMLNSFSLSADNAADVADLLFAIVKRGKTTLEELAPVIGQVASIAASGNLSIEEFGAALATMTRAGVRTENAVTSLRAIISSFLKPTDDSAKAAKELGFELSSTTLATEGLLGVFKRLQLLSPEQISRLFPNIRALKGVIPALKQMTGFTADIGIMADRAGSAEVAFKKMTNTLMFSFKQMLQSGVRVFDALGEAIEKPLEEVAVVLRKTGQVLTAWINDNRDLIRMLAKGVLVFGAASAALVTLGSALTVGSVMLMGLVSAMTLVGSVTGTVVAVLGAMMSTIGVLAAQAAILGTAFLLTGDRLKGLEDIGGKAIDSLAAKFADLKGEAMESFKGIADAMAAGDMSLAADILWTTIKKSWEEGIGSLETMWLEFKNFIKKQASDIPNAAAAAASESLLKASIRQVKAQAGITTGRANRAAAIALAANEAGRFVAKRPLVRLLTGESREDVDERLDDAARKIRARATDIEVDQRIKAQNEIERLEKEHKKRMEAIGGASLKDEAERDLQLRGLKKETANKVIAIEEDLARKIRIAARKAQAEEDVQSDIRARAIRIEQDKFSDSLKAESRERAKRAKEIVRDSRLGRLGDIIEGGMRRFQEGSARGTFNAFALQSLMGTRGDDRLLTAAQATAKNTAQIAKQGPKGGVFTGGKTR